VLPVHFLRAFFVGLFHVDRLFGPRPCGSHPLGHYFILCGSFVGSFFVPSCARWVILSWESFFCYTFSCVRWVISWELFVDFKASMTSSTQL
jgi:hypothetical protein